MDFSRAEGAENAERKSGLCDATYYQIVTCACVKKALCPFSAIIAPLREPVFPSFGLKDEDKTKQNGPRQWVFVASVCQFPRTPRTMSDAAVVGQIEIRIGSLPLTTLLGRLKLVK
jgi:hypothetical protein